MTDTQPRRLKDFEPLTTAERQVLEGLDTGAIIRIGNDVPDADAGEDRLIHARFLRWVILGCDGSDKHRVHEKGVQIFGALITGEGEDRKRHAALDLEGAEVPQNLQLINCRFTAMPEMIRARMQSLILNRSHLPGLEADGLETRGNVALDSIESDGEIRLLGAQIGGNLDCNGAKSSNALSADGARIKGGFFWRRGAAAKGAIDLTAAEIGDINDDPNCWPSKGDLLLNRCRYGAFTGKGVSGAERLDWLSRVWDPTGEFRPQPYEQCAKVLREMGHQDDAREILIEKERRQREARRNRERKWMARAMRVRDWFLGWSVCYGQKPLRAAWWLLGLWLFGTLAFWGTHAVDQFKPNNAFVLRADEWVNCGKDAKPREYLARTGETQLNCFERQPEGLGFPAFDAAVYSLDVLFPLVQLEQQVHWVPDEDQLAGLLAKWLVYVQIVMGWLLSLLAVAGLSGIIKSD